MIYNYIKCESVIAKIMADLDSTEVRQRVSDIKEWVFEALEQIGAPMQYIKKESGTDTAPLLKIQDHQVPLPADLVVLEGAAYSQFENGPWISMVPSTSIFETFDHKKRIAPQTNTVPHDPANKAIQQEEVLVLEHQPIAEKIKTSQSQLYTINGMKYSEKFVDAYLNNKPEYFIKPGWMVVNKDKGFIKLSYKAIATDERGYPLIPDLLSYQEAIYWYCVMKLSFPKYMSGKLGGRGVNSAQNVYFYTQQQWNFYRNQAYAEAMMPTAGDMENIKNNWNRLIPEWDADQTFFKNINKEQSTYTDYYHGY